ncbi:hypothetical protein C4553_00935 [Candidatus Parcubacteria bacterium]|nr:MAG: hypothetical protein C4553_00935 [Candidatus Parcubacteria bacterium]
MKHNFPTKNIWKLMLDILPSTNSLSKRKDLGGKKLLVDFVHHRSYKEAVVPIARLASATNYESSVRRKLIDELEDLEHRHILLNLKNKGARFVVKIPKIELD